VSFISDPQQPSDQQWHLSPLLIGGGFRQRSSRQHIALVVSAINTRWRRHCGAFLGPLDYHFF
jgi:hypothetical protein